MLLVFEGWARTSLIRPAQVAAVLTALEEVFLVTLLRDAPPPDHRAARVGSGLRHSGHSGSGSRA